MNRSLRGTLLLLCIVIPASEGTAQTAWRTRTPHLDRVIEGEDTDLFSTDAYAFAGADGGSVVADPDGLHILLISPDGTFQTIGKEGEGPAEFRGIRSVGPLGNDAFWVADTRLTRIQVFTGRGKLDRILRYSQSMSVSPSASFIQWPIALLDTTRILMSAGYVAGNGGDFTRGHSVGDRVLAVVHGEDIPAAMVWQVKEPRCSRMLNDVSVEVPYCQSPLADASPDGRAVALVRDLSGTGPNGMIGVTLSKLGAPEVGREVRFATGARKRVAKEDRATVEKKAARRYQSFPEILRQHRALLDEAHYHPAFDRLLVGDDGTAWIGLPKDNSRIWLAIDSAGRILGGTEFPLEERVVASRGRTLWTTLLDADGFADLRKYQYAR